jgi:hypothetical protein
MSYFDQLIRRYRTLLYFCLGLALGSFYLVYTGSLKPWIMDKDEKLLQLIVVIAAGFSVIKGFRNFNQLVLALRNTQKNVKDKLNAYRRALLKFWNMLVLPVVLAITGFAFTTTYSFFILACFVIGIIAMFMPRKATIALLLKLNESELLLLDQVI